MTLGKRIKKLRKQKKLSQEQLAELLDVSESTVSLWERDIVVPTTINFFELAEALETDVKTIWKGEKHEK